MEPKGNGVGRVFPGKIVPIYRDNHSTENKEMSRVRSKGVLE